MEWTSVQLRALAELPERGTVTEVARALGYTPGAVSQQLSALERSAGRQLLRRVGRRVELTDAGWVLARSARDLLDGHRGAMAEIEGLGDDVGGRVAIGLFATAAAEILPTVLARVRRCHPRIAVRSRDMEVDEVFDAVAAGSVDLALGLDYPDAPIPRDRSLVLSPLVSERFSLAVPRGHCRPGKAMGLSDTAALPWVLPAVSTHYGAAVRAACRRVGVEPDVQHEVTDTAASLALVEAGVGITTVTGLMLRLRTSDVEVVPLAERIERQIVLVSRKGAARPSVAAVTGILARLEVGPDGVAHVGAASVPGASRAAE
ncbi:LysR family transcriptional regulator [Nakamurella deserti]|uniref:LysR family transcriptional regulator n=1 Tax=Nakamurella deserti TaxID=2164074 RepID=UPI000DBE8D9B|nr:LysR family transcriptional regulator [Nakamurella deserti]